MSEIHIKNPIEEYESGRESFDLLLKIISQNDILFLADNFMNTGNFYYFFYSERIPNNEKLLHKLEDKESLNNGYLTLNEIKDQLLSIYFGIRNKNELEYGFYNTNTRMIYRIGKFKCDKYFFQKLPKNKCFQNIREFLKGIHLLHMPLLHTVKKDLKDWWSHLEDSKVKILDFNRLKKIVSKKYFKPEDFNNEARLIFTFDSYCKQFDWFNRVYTYVEVGEEYINFYVRTRV